MKKILLSAGIMAIISTACEKSEYNISPDNFNATITASIEGQTKSTVSSDYSFCWSQYDKIDVWYTSTDATSPTKRTFTYSSPESVTEAEFSGTIVDGETCSGYGVYPSGNHSLAGGVITVNMPATYGNADVEYAPNTNAVMIAVPGDATSAASTETPGEAPSLSFKHVGGVLAFTIKNVPEGAAQFVFTANMPITGNFDVEDGKITTEEQAVAPVANNTVTIKFKALEEEKDAMTFYVPLPTGEYKGYKAEIKNSDGTTEYMKFESNSTNTLSRAGLANVTLVITGVDATTPALEVSSPSALKSAFANGGSYILTSSITVDETLTLPAGKELNLNLGDYILTSNVTVAEVPNSKVAAIKNSGIMNIVSGTNGGIVAQMRGFYNEEGAKATLDCNITSENSNAVCNYYKSELTIKGGKYESKFEDTGCAVRMGDKPTDTAWTLKIEGGTFIAPWAALYLCNNYYGLETEGSATINGGTFTGNTADIGAAAVRNITISDNCILTHQTIKNLGNNPASYDCKINSVDLNDSDNHYSDVFSGQSQD